MDDMSCHNRSAMKTGNDIRAAAIQLGKLLIDHRGQDVKVLDLSGKNSWTDYFVIATTSSSTHSRGLQRHVHEALKETGLEIRPTKRRIPDGDEWILMDLGAVIVHLMTPAARNFYDLEKLWYGAPDLLSDTTEVSPE
jgi:ribosome-associated protein